MLLERSSANPLLAQYKKHPYMPNSHYSVHNKESLVYSSYLSDYDNITKNQYVQFSSKFLRATFPLFHNIIILYMMIYPYGLSIYGHTKPIQSKLLHSIFKLEISIVFPLLKLLLTRLVALSDLGK